MTAEQSTKTLLDKIQAACAAGPISYADYIQMALYTERLGYYARKQERVGRDAQRDFYTAESLGAVFARLVSTAAEDLLPAGIAAQSTFIEIAAEPGQALLAISQRTPSPPAKSSAKDSRSRPRDPLSFLLMNGWMPWPSIA